MQTEFDRQLQRGQVSEGLIAKWLRKRGKYVMPVYQMEIHTGKGPQIFSAEEDLVAPDMLIVGDAVWIEAKHKSVFSWYRKGRYWTTGIDQRHYEDYQRVQVKSGWPVWVLFLHEKSTPWNKDVEFGCPSECPTGLFSASLVDMHRCESHKTPALHAVDDVRGHGRSGMVYWARREDGGPLRKIAPLEELEALRAY